ncbi:unnamed protein product, partial [marine sediment metagenome]
LSDKAKLKRVENILYVLPMIILHTPLGLRNGSKKYIAKLKITHSLQKTDAI